MAGGTLTMIVPALLLLVACAPEPTATGPTAPGPTVDAQKPPQPAASRAREDFNGFWTRFRAAALAGDAAALRAMSAPTVESRGEMDDDPVLKLTPAQVPKAVAALMDRPDGADPQGRTLRQIVRSKVRFQPSEFHSPDHQRVGDLEFARGRAGWRLTTVYRGPDE